MSAAKLFILLTLVFAVLAGLSRLAQTTGLDVSSHGSYLGVGSEIVLLFAAVAGANFAVLYYAAERIFRAHWNRALVLLHFALFLCFAICLSMVFVFSGSVANGGVVPESFRWAMVPYLLGIFSLVASLVVFGINLSLTAVQVLRVRLARR